MEKNHPKQDEVLSYLTDEWKFWKDLPGATIGSGSIAKALTRLVERGLAEMKLVPGAAHAWDANKKIKVRMFRLKQSTSKGN